jgi:predicted dehydrogenase
VKFLIAGYGSIGRRHFRNLLALGENDILFYRTHKSPLPEAELAGFQVETDLKEALKAQPEAVIIANPTALHLDIAIPAAEAGCHLLIEKPVSHSLEGIDRLEAALQSEGGRVLVGYHFRHHPGLQHIADQLAQGVIGKPLSVRAHWGEYLPAWHPWEDYRQGYSARADLGGGVVLTLSHPFDYLRWLMGEVQAVWAFTGRLSSLELDVEDTAEIGLHFASGAIGSLHLDYNQQPPSHTLEIIGTQGTLCWDSSPQVGASGSNQVDRNALFLSEMSHFIDIIRNGTAPLCSLYDGVMALHLALAALESAHHGRLVGIPVAHRVGE